MDEVTAAVRRFLAAPGVDGLLRVGLRLVGALVLLGLLAAYGLYDAF